MEKVIIFDTTLRDGEQAPGASLSCEQKIEVAHQLEKLGVDVIEAGFPVSSPGDFKSVEEISKKIRKCITCALARCVKKDIEYASKALKKAKRPRIHIFLATSKIHLKYKFKKRGEEILRIAKRYVRLARKLCSDIEFSPEDATRTEKSFLFKVIETAIKEGARTINIPDTVGYSYPQEIFSLIKEILNNVPNINKATLSIHCHNDLGMAVANSLSAVLAGVRQIHCTVNGIGERAGNASLEEIVMAIKTRRDVFDRLYTSVNTKEIFKTSKLVSTLTGFLVPPNKAIVGRNAFSHEAGIHQDAILKERTTYEIMDPKEIGLPGTQLILGKHSGRHALFKRLKDLGFKLTKKHLDLVFKRFKVLADKKKEIFDEDLIAIVQEQSKPKKQIIKLLGVRVESGTDITPQAEVELLYKGRKSKAISFGDGPVDACFKAVDKITKIKPRLLQYKLSALTSGRDAQGEVWVELKQGKRVVWGTSLSTDIIEASLKAYLEALNKLL
ncbi:MAG: 2-isopropylmalate synthase [Candidatus Omnitrophica bacterium]|nr:2-isopropylmalate synthase [Candidatus Omnitrophota bacterium]